jgi:hypothetical protein
VRVGPSVLHDGVPLSAPLKLSGTFVEAAALSSFVEALPKLTDLDVRYCARVRKLHWLAESLRRCAEQRRRQQRQHRQAEEQLEAQRHIVRRGVGGAHPLTQCSDCPMVCAHCPHKMPPSTVNEAAAAASAVDAGLSTAAVPVAALPITGGGWATSRPSNSSSDAILPPHSRRFGNQPRSGGAALPSASVTRLPTSSAMLPAHLTALPCTATSARVAPCTRQTAVAQRTFSSSSLCWGRAAATELAPPSCLTQGALDNNHCYLTAGSATDESDNEGCDKGVKGGGPSTRQSQEMLLLDKSAVPTPPDTTVVLQGAVPGLFAVPALW